MTNQHPITPPPELVQQWSVSSPIQVSDETLAYEIFIAHQAARWGANQELEECITWLNKHIHHPGFEPVADRLRAARRALTQPKPPSLKERLSKAIIDGNEREALKLLEALPE